MTRCPRLTLAGAMFVFDAGDLVAGPCGILHDAAVVGGDSVVSLDAMRRN